MNPTDLKHFETSLLGYYVSKKLSDGKTYAIFDTNAYMRDQGAMKYYDSGKYWTIADLGKYIEIEKKLEALSKLRSRRDYAKKQELLARDAMQ